MVFHGYVRQITIASSGAPSCDKAVPFSCAASAGAGVHGEAVEAETTSFDVTLVDMATGQNLWCHIWVNEHPFTIYFDVH